MSKGSRDRTKDHEAYRDNYAKVFGKKSYTYGNKRGAKCQKCKRFLPHSQLRSTWNYHTLCGDCKDDLPREIPKDWIWPSDNHST